MKKNTVRVYDTVSKKYVDVEASEEVCIHYNRTQWNIDDNNKSFYNHEIQFSSFLKEIIIPFACIGGEVGDLIPPEISFF